MSPTVSDAALPEGVPYETRPYRKISAIPIGKTYLESDSKKRVSDKVTNIFLKFFEQN